MFDRFLAAGVFALMTLSLPARAEPIEVRVGKIIYVVDPATLKIDAQDEQYGLIPLLKPVGEGGETSVTKADGAWMWSTREGQQVRLTTDGDALKISVTGKTGTQWRWSMATASDGTWIVPDGEGMAFDVNDPFWRSTYSRNRCFGGTTTLSFPAWSYLSRTKTVTYALDDGFQSKLCLEDINGLQANLSHEFVEGGETVDILVHLGQPDPLAPAHFYRDYLKRHGRLQTFADKKVPDLDRLFGAPHAYVWGDGRDLVFLDELKALGIHKLVISYDQDPKTGKYLVQPAYLKKAHALGYLAGPYDAFDNGQPDAMADMPAAMWGPDLYPSGCLRDAKGAIVPGFANRGCQMSSQAIANHSGGFVPAKRYADHIEAGASQVFIDVDAFGTFYDDFSPDHRMTKAQDRNNRLARMGMGIKTFGLVQGSENVTAWSSGVTHYTHGTGQAHMIAVWPILNDTRFKGYWPPERPPIYFGHFTPTPEEARGLFGPADRLPLFEAVYHDDVVAVDRWEFGLTRVMGAEKSRYARALLYGIPTMWNLDRRELKTYGAWLKAAHDDFQAVHGVSAPVALTQFEWLSDNRLVQRVQFADGRTVTANFGDSVWKDLQPNCVRVSGSDNRDTIFCPPKLPAE
ncbi:glycoside hydrolase [Asticcacaulis benevestitus]|uniref:Uncharacterized protein n=1 Tax=Asticcacaulis benevestitus DSM 16100 = ATCC BAA-896 TaxID=1121022 RepID=V4PMP3_9CAUL|nr:glycoside hydrolase [Asticcacaulis benevestitus]ESQ86735.1 hypothetical protein ABENE_18045 [Asticcacaulis benevestitus DSM 16100 = ATCC BAA-896]